ncbi:MAG TPA: alpha/beta fold hydrolase [Nitrospiria bacterium]|nr:alpha/beta fold hydrolase [Nitrospiria bacterium]
MSAHLEYLELPAERNPSGCVVALHGRGVDGEDLMPLAAMLDFASLRFVFPHAPLEAEFGGRAWYPLTSESHEAILKSRNFLLELIRTIEKQGTPAAMIALMGFSQGGVMSLDAGLRYPKRLAGVASLSGYLHDPEHLATEKGEIAGLPVFIAHGTADDVLPVSGSRQAAKLLQGTGVAVTYKEYPIGHQIIPEEIDDLRVFLKSCFPSV